MGKSREAISFYSSLLAGLFVATSFLFVSYFIPYGENNWSLDWFLLTIFAILYCILYYYMGIYLIRKLNAEEVNTYRKDFFASLIVSVYFSIITLFKFKLIPLIITTLVALVITSLICYKIAHKKY